jgi:hypothetical protein
MQGSAIGAVCHPGYWYSGHTFTMIVNVDGVHAGWRILALAIVAYASSFFSPVGTRGNRGRDGEPPFGESQTIK